MFSKIEIQPAHQSHHNDEGGLEGMYHEGEEDSRRFSHAVEHEHRFDGKMPRPCPVGGGNEHGKGAGAENEQCRCGVDAGSEVVAEEGQIEVQIIACPNADAVEQIEQRMLQPSQGGHAVEKALHLLPPFLKGFDPPKEKSREAHGQQKAEGGDEIARGGEARQDGVGRGACGVKKTEKLRELRGKGRHGNDHHQYRIDHAFGHDGAQRFGKRDAGILLQRAAAGHFAHSGNGQTRGIGNENCIRTNAAGGMLTQRPKRQLPAEGTEGERHDAESQRKEHPTPVQMQEAAPDLSPVAAPIHPPKDADAERKGYENFNYADY